MNILFMPESWIKKYRLLNLNNEKSAAEAKIIVPLWQLGIEKGVATQFFDNSRFTIEEGELVLSLKPWQSEILKINRP